MFPIVIDVAALLAFAAYAIVAVTYLPLWAVVALVPVAAVSITFAAVMSVVVMKRLLMGTFAPVIKPLWSVYVWLNECLNGADERWPCRCCPLCSVPRSSIGICVDLAAKLGGTCSWIRNCFQNSTSSKLATTRP